MAVEEQNKCYNNITTGVRCYLNESWTMNLTAANIIYVNATTGTTAAITINDSNVVLDCNRSTIHGNGTGYGILSLYQNRFTQVKNCTVTDYKVGVYLNSNYNSLVDSNTIDNFTVYGIYTPDNAGAISKDNNTISNNHIVKCDGTATSDGIYTTGSGASYITNNNVDGECMHGIAVTASAANVSITGNKVNNSDECIQVRDSRDIYIANNNLSNCTADYDEYDVGILIGKTLSVAYDMYNITIFNNRLNEITSAGIVSIANVTNLNISNNTFDFVPFSERGKYASRDATDFPCAVIISPLYKGFLNGNPQNTWKDTIVNTSRLLTINVTMNGNVFDSDTQCYAKLVGVNIFNNDLSSYWYNKIQFPVDLLNATEIYIPNSVTTLQRYHYSLLTEQDFYYNDYSAAGDIFRYNWSKNLFSITNRNASTSFNISWTSLAFNQSKTLASGETFYITDSDCIVPNTAGYTLNNTDTKLCGGNSYYLNETTGNGALKLNVSNLVLDCMGAELWGTNDTNNYGIYASARSNLTIKNCILHSYLQGIRLLNSGNITATNNTVYSAPSTNVSFYGIELFRCPYSSVTNNYITGANNGIYILGSNDSVISSNRVQYSRIACIKISDSPPNGNYRINVSNNNLSNCYTTTATIDTGGGISVFNNIFNGGVLKTGYLSLDRITNSEIHNNNFLSIGNTSTYQTVLISKCNNTLFRNNELDFGMRGTVISDGQEVNLSNNILSNFDIGVEVIGAKSILLNNNQYSNMTRNADSYNMGIYITDNATDVNISNEIIGYGHTGIWAQMSKNIYIKNITCNQISLQDALNGVLNLSVGTSAWLQRNEPTSCILIGETYEGWVGDSTETANDYLVKFRKYNVTDVNISDIHINTHVQSYLITNGIFGTFAYDLPSNWYRKFWTPANMSDAYEFFNVNTWNTLQTASKVSDGITSTMWRSQCGMGIYRCTKVNYTMSKYSMSFINVNDTQIYQLNLSNLSLTGASWQVFNGSDSNPQCDGSQECNLTLASGQRAFVFSYSTSSQPMYMQIAKTVTTLSVISYNGKTASFDCTGSGVIKLDLQGVKTPYNVFHNGRYVDINKNDRYYFTDGSCSSWEFNQDEVPLSQTSPISYTLMTVGLACLLGIVLICMAGYPVMQNWDSWETEDWVKWLMYAFIVITIGIVVIVYIFQI